MAEILDYDAGDIEIPMFLEEGTCTVTDNVQGPNGTLTTYTFESELKKGDTVILHTTDKTVKAPSAGATELFGKIIDTPRWVGNKPTSTKTTGNYQRRVATIRIFGSGVYPVDVEAANSAIAVGKSIKPGASTIGKYDLYHATNLNNTRAIQAAGASSGAKIGVVFGFYGNLA